MREALIAEMGEHVQSPGEWILLGNRYYAVGKNDRQNYTKANLCYEEALRLNPNYPAAHYNLGLLYQDGLGLNKNLPQAKRHYERAIEQFPQDARRQLLKIEMSENGWSVANEWNGLGIKYDKGENGRSIDRVKERLCYEEAIKLSPNHPSAHYNVGLMFKLGQGVEKSLKQASDHFKKAATNGHENAKRELLKIEMNEHGWSTADDWNRLGVKYHIGEEAQKISYVSAEICYQEALALDPKVNYAADNLSLITNIKKSAHDVFKAAYYNQLPQLRYLLEINPALRDKKFHEKSPGITQVAHWGLYVGKKGLGLFTTLVGSPKLLVDKDRKSLYSVKIRDGWTPLHFAAWGDSVDTAKFLIEEGADISLRDDSQRTYIQLGNEAFRVACKVFVQTREDKLARQKAENDVKELAQQLQAEQADRRVAQQRANAIGEKNTQLNHDLAAAHVREQERQEQIHNLNQQVAQSNAQIEQQDVQIGQQGAQIAQQGAELQQVQSMINGLGLFSLPKADSQPVSVYQPGLPH